jgi:hypothetical protein
MSNPEPVALFADNWAYFKTELNWLDRVLMMAVSRQKRDTSEVDDFATPVKIGSPATGGKGSLP